MAVVWDGWKVASYREALMWENGGAVGKEADGDSEGVGGRWHRITRAAVGGVASREAGHVVDDLGGEVKFEFQAIQATLRVHTGREADCRQQHGGVQLPSWNWNRGENGE